MKKTTFAARCIAVLLTVLIFMSFSPLSMFVFAEGTNEGKASDISADAAEKSVPGGYSVSTLANPSSATPSASMLNNVFLDALAYTGYNVSKQRNDNTLFVQGYYGNSLKIKIDSGAYPNILSGIPYSANTSRDGLAVKSESDPSKTKTGVVPDIAKIKKTGLVCGGYVTYVFMNYLPNVKGITYQGLADVLPGGTESAYAWYDALETLAAQGKATKIAIGTPDFKLLNKIDASNRDSDITYIDWSRLEIGDIIIFGNEKNLSWSSVKHVAIYAGTCNNGWLSGAHLITHVGNSRGPEISEVRYMASKTNTSPSASSIPVAVYRLKVDTGVSVTVPDPTPTPTPTPESPIEKLPEPTPGPGKIKVKNSVTNGGAASGWTFTVYSNSSCSKAVTTLTTNSKGVATSDELSPGTYWVKETDAPVGIDTSYWKISTSAQKVTVKSGGTATVSFTSKYLGRVQVICTEPNGGTAEGWSYTFYKDEECTEAHTSVTTDSSGAVTTARLSPGTYYVKETGVPEGIDTSYWKIDDAVRTVTVTVGKTEDISFENRLYGRGEIVMTTSGSGTVEGWQFTVYRDSECTDIVDAYFTDAQGRTVTENLAPGSYYVKAAGYPEGESDRYWDELSEEPVLMTVSAGETAAVTFISGQSGLVVVKEILLNPEAGTLNGWSFELRNAMGDLVGTYMTDADGFFVSDKLEPGEYTITELLGNDSVWLCTEENTISITITAGETAEAEFENTLRSGKITIKAADEANEPLSDVRFLLEWSDDGEVWQPVHYNAAELVEAGGCMSEGLRDGVLTAGADGTVVFEGLYPLHYYRVTEIEAPEGYQLPEASVFEGQLEIDNNFELALQVANDPVPDAGCGAAAPLSAAVIAPAAVGFFLLLTEKRKITA